MLSPIKRLKDIEARLEKFEGYANALVIYAEAFDKIGDLSRAKLAEVQERIASANGPSETDEAILRLLNELLDITEPTVRKANEVIRDKRD